MAEASTVGDVRIRLARRQDAAGFGVVSASIVEFFLGVVGGVFDCIAGVFNVLADAFYGIAGAETDGRQQEREESYAIDEL